MTADANPLVDDRFVDFLLYEVLDIRRLCALPHFADHDRDTFDLVLAGARRVARDVLYPAYRALDEAPPRLVDGRVRVHPLLKDIYAQLVRLGFTAAPRPHEVGGQQLPLTVSAASYAYLMAGNAAAFGYVGLTQGAAHLLEAFGDDRLRREYMDRMYRGEWTGTMALTEPQAGSSLSDVQATATPTPDGHYLISGSKIFISGGDHDLTDNVVHMTLARIRGAPAGIKGVSLFCVPKRRVEDGRLVDNDVNVTGVIHKIGWRGLPSLALGYGERGDCHGWLVGEPHRGIGYMFQMMNEARILVGLHGVSTASVAYQEALSYARGRPQGRSLTARDPSSPQVAIIEHADVRRMLLRQKAIVEGGLALLLRTAWYADHAAHAVDDADRGEAESAGSGGPASFAGGAGGRAPRGIDRDRAGLLVDLLTPVAKTFPAERGFESCALAVQIHGGYGYSSEYLPESWLRDQKLNSIHEGTTGIQALDLLGRRAVARGGAALAALRGEILATAARARAGGVDPAWGAAVERGLDALLAVTAELAKRGTTDPDAMMLHAADYLDLFSTVVVAWQWLELAAAAGEGLARGDGNRTGFYRGQLCAAQYWIATELPKVEHLAHLCRSGEDSYVRLDPAWL